MNGPVDSLLTQIREYSLDRGWDGVVRSCDELSQPPALTILVASTQDASLASVLPWLQQHAPAGSRVAQARLGDLLDAPEAILSSAFVVALFGTSGTASAAELQVLQHLVMDRPDDTRAVLLHDSDAPLGAEDDAVIRRYAWGLFVPGAKTAWNGEDLSERGVYLWSEQAAAGDAAPAGLAVRLAAAGAHAGSQRRLVALRCAYALQRATDAAHAQSAAATASGSTRGGSLQVLADLRERLAAKARTLVDELQGSLLASLGAVRGQMHDRLPERVAASPAPEGPQEAKAAWLLDLLQAHLRSHMEAYQRTVAEASDRTTRAWSEGVDRLLGAVDWTALAESAAAAGLPPPDMAQMRRRLEEDLTRGANSPFRQAVAMESDSTVWAAPAAGTMKLAMTITIAAAAAAIGAICASPLGALLGSVGAVVAGPLGFVVGGAAGAAGTYNVMTRAAHESQAASALEYGRRAIDLHVSGIESQIREQMTRLRTDMLAACRSESDALEKIFTSAAERLADASDSREDAMRKIAGWQQALEAASQIVG